MPKSVRSPKRLQIRPRGSGLPVMAGSCNVSRRGEPSGWRQPEPDLNQVRGPLENPVAANSSTMKGP